MLYELARRLKDEGKSAAEIRAELLKVGANKDEINVLLGSLGLAANTHTAAPELLNKTSRITGSRWTLGLMFLLLIAVLSPVIYVIALLVGALRSGR